MPLSRWKLICPGLCRLVSYSDGFSKLVKHPKQVLTECFTCVQLYAPSLYSKTPYFFSLISSGRVESFAMRTLVQCYDGRVIEAMEILKIEFENDKPCAVVCCIKPLDYYFSSIKNQEYLQPFLVKVYNPKETKAISPNSTFVDESLSSLSGDDFSLLPPAQTTDPLANPTQGATFYSSPNNIIGDTSPVVAPSSSSPFSSPISEDYSPGNNANNFSPQSSNTSPNNFVSAAVQIHNLYSDDFKFPEADQTCTSGSLFSDQDFSKQHSLFDWSNTNSGSACIQTACKY